MIKILSLGILIVLIAAFILQSPGVPDAPPSVSTAVQETVENTMDVSTPEEGAISNEPTINSDKVLDLSGQGLRKTPSSVFEKTDIEKLDLSNNALDGSLQAEVRHLQNLKILDLSNNQFTGVPAEIGQLQNLEILILSHNQITGLPYELGNLSNLKLLDLRGNDYSLTDLETIKKGLPQTTGILTQ